MLLSSIMRVFTYNYVYFGDIIGITNSNNQQCTKQHSLYNRLHFTLLFKVRIAMYTDEEEVMFTTFNASGSTQLTWMDPDHIIHSTYTDIIGQPHYEDFSVSG